VANTALQLSIPRSSAPEQIDMASWVSITPRECCPGREPASLPLLFRVVGGTRCCWNVRMETLHRPVSFVPERSFSFSTPRFRRSWLGARQQRTRSARHWSRLVYVCDRCASFDCGTSGRHSSRHATFAFPQRYVTRREETATALTDLIRPLPPGVATGLVYGAGSNWSGVLGRMPADLVQTAMPVLIPLPRRATAVACGARTSAVLLGASPCLYVSLLRKEPPC
jgi:hypothetical protein